MVSQIKLGEIAVDVILKDIKNVYLSVYPPTGRVRITAPEAHEPRHRPRVRCFQTCLDPETTETSIVRRSAKLSENISTGKVTMSGGDDIYSRLKRWVARQRWS